MATDWGVPGNDITHRFVVHYIYEFPFGRGRRFGSNTSKPVNWMLGGWQQGVPDRRRAK
jgi:hypothetical protein